MPVGGRRCIRGGPCGGAGELFVAAAGKTGGAGASTGNPLSPLGVSRAGGAAIPRGLF